MANNYTKGVNGAPKFKKKKNYIFVRLYEK